MRLVNQGFVLTSSDSRVRTPVTGHDRLRDVRSALEAGMTNVEQDGRVALITGGSRGIGAAVARLLASRGLRVAVNYRSSRDEADGAVASIASAGGRAMAVQADVRDRPAVLGMVEQVRDSLGGVEVLVHSALIPYAIKSYDLFLWVV